MPDWPKVKYKEEGMREGMQIEDSQISIEDKVELLDMLSETGLQQIVVGSFVSPKWTPQMERIDEIVTRFKPKPGVTYTALALNSSVLNPLAADSLSADSLRNKAKASLLPFMP